MYRKSAGGEGSGAGEHRQGMYYGKADMELQLPNGIAGSRSTNSICWSHRPNQIPS